MKQRVVSLSDFGPAENMSLIEADIPTPGSGQIVVKNNAIGLNYLDTYFRSGLYPWPNNNDIKFLVLRELVLFMQLVLMYQILKKVIEFHT